MSQEWRARPAKAEKKQSTEYTASDWLRQMKLAETRNEKWENRCRKIIKRYRNEKAINDKGAGEIEQNRMNVLWSNVQTLKPSVYGRIPTPIAERRFLDPDKTGRIAAQVLERALRHEITDCGFEDTVPQTIDDYLLVGRGVAWIRFRPIIGPETSLADRGDDDLNATEDTAQPREVETDLEEPDRDGEQPTEQTPQEKLLSAGIDVDYVHWSDFLHSKARFWRENAWVARRLYPSRADLVADFGEDIGNRIPLEMSPEQEEIKGGSHAIDKASEIDKKAIVYEIWNKATRTVYTVAKGFDEWCEEPREDPLNLEEFWPCPKPLFATMTNDTLEPVPDYLEYQDQALQIDSLTNRISLLTKALKVAGVYDAANKELARLLDEGNENKLIPVKNWAQLSEKGGLDKGVSFVPIKEVADTMMALVQARDKIKEDMFEITGLSDIIRGQADPRETAEAVQTKGRWGSLRLQARQMAVARYCRDIIRMMGEIISEHYPAELLISISGAMYDEGIGDPPPEPPAKPDDAPNPMLGHNGGPPMAPGALRQPGMPGPAGNGPSMAPGIGAGNLGPLSAPLGGITPPPLTPQQQYAVAMMQYQQKMAVYMQEKQALILRAIDLLRQEKMRGFRIDIETDSTIEQDASEEKRSRTEFIAATTKFVSEAFQIGAQVPDAAPMLGKMLLFGVRGFRAGRDLESTIEEFVDKMEKDAVARQNAPPPPNPEVQKAQIELQGVQAKSQAEVTKAQLADAQAKDDAQREMMSRQFDLQIDGEKLKAELVKLQQEAAIKTQEAVQKMEELRLKMDIMKQEHGQKVEHLELSHKAEMLAHRRKMSEMGKDVGSEPEMLRLKEPSEEEKLKADEIRQRMVHDKEAHKLALEKAEWFKKPRLILRDANNKIIGFH